jgi:hypothetical protein
MTGLDRELAKRAFEAGFLAAVDPRKRRGRHAVDARTHQHWRRGHQAGVAALRDAVALYDAAELAGRTRTTPDFLP